MTLDIEKIKKDDPNEEDQKRVVDKLQDEFIEHAFGDVIKEIMDNKKDNN